MPYKRWKNLIISASVTAAIIFPCTAQGSVFDFVGKLRVGFGYYDNDYLRELRDTSTRFLISKGFRTKNYDQIYDGNLALGIFIDLSMYYKNFGFGVSSGVTGFINYLYVSYDDAVVDKRYALLKLNAYLLPQNLNVYYKIPLAEKLFLRIGAGPGYYLTLLTNRIEVRGTNAGSHKNDYYKIHDKDKLKHDFGIQALAELSYKFSETFSFDFGCNCHAMFGLSPIKLTYQGYVGLTETLNF